MAVLLLLLPFGLSVHISPVGTLAPPNYDVSPRDDHERESNTTATATTDGRRRDLVTWKIGEKRNGVKGFWERTNGRGREERAA